MAFTKYTGNITGQNGSLITALDAALVTGEGWTKAYGDANNGAYVQAAGNGFYLRVEDDGPGAGGAKEARITGYEAMSDIDTGTGPFPTAAQGVGGVAMVVARKSASADATNRSYKIFADDRTAYVFISTGDTAGEYMAFAFGDFYSLQAADGYRTMIVGRIAENSATASNDRLDTVGSNLTTSTSGHFIARSYTGLGTSITWSATGDYAKSLASTILAGGLTYPNSPDGGAYFSQVWIGEDAIDVVRGRLRGFWQFLHPIASVSDGDTMTGTGSLTGKTIEFVKQSANDGVYAIETSDTLETN